MEKNPGGSALITILERKNKQIIHYDFNDKENNKILIKLKVPNITKEVKKIKLEKGNYWVGPDNDYSSDEYDVPRKIISFYLLFCIFDKYLWKPSSMHYPTPDDYDDENKHKPIYIDTVVKCRLTFKQVGNNIPKPPAESEKDFLPIEYNVIFDFNENQFDKFNLVPSKYNHFYEFNSGDVEIQIANKYENTLPFKFDKFLMTN